MRRGLLVPLLLLAILAAAEGGIRLTALVLRRDDSPLKRAAAGGRVIYVIGDSFTYGAGVDREEAYPKVLERLLNGASSTGRADVNNLGFPGLSSANAYFAVARAIRQGDAAIILVMTGWNANDSDFIQHAHERSEPVPVSARIEDLLENLRVYKLAKQVLTHKSRAAVLDEIELVPPTAMELYDFRAYQEIAYKHLRKIAKLCRDFDVPLVLLNYPYQDLPKNKYSKNEYYHVLYGRTKPSPEEYLIEDRVPDEIAIHAVIRKVGEEEGVPVIDFQEAFVRSARKGLFQSDWHHPSAAGHELMARAIFDAIGPKLVRLVDAMPAGEKSL